MMGHDGWRLTVDFEPRESQEQDSPEYAWPYDHASRLVAFIGERWSRLPEDDDVRFADDGTQVVLESESIDAFADVFEWLLMHTTPIRVMLTATFDGKPIPTVDEVDV